VIRAWLAHRRTDAERRVLAALRHGPPATAYDLAYRTGIGGLRLDAAVLRLEEAGVLVAEETTPPLYRMAHPCPVCAGHQPDCREAT
jgi:hypothetical protein